MALTAEEMLADTVKRAAEKRSAAIRGEDDPSTDWPEPVAGAGRGKSRNQRSEIQAVGFPQDSWTPAQARKWMKDHGAVPIKGMRREGSWLRWRITPPDRYSRYTTKTLRSNGKAIHLVMGSR